MSQMGKNVIKLVALGLVAAVVVGITEVAVEADPGQVHFTVHIPDAAQCGNVEFRDPGSALALVSGGKAGFPKFPVLLVTSCVPAAGSPPNLFLLDPFGSPPDPEGIFNAALVKTLPTVFSTTTNRPDFGWEALVLRADRGDLLACGSTAAGQTVLHSVDFGPLSTAVDGLATFFRNGPPGSSCDAIAWDASNKTIYQTYQTPAVDADVFHFKEDGTAVTPKILSGCPTPISGLGVAGTSLFVGCKAVAGPDPIDSTIRQVYKVDGTSVRPNFDTDESALPGPSADPAGLPDDPTTLASEYKELLWTLDAVSARLLAVEIPGATIGQLTGVPVLFPGVGDPSLTTSCQPNPTTGAYASSAGDSLLDCWKTPWSDGRPGISYSGNYDRTNLANRDVVLCAGDTSTPANINANCAVSTSQKDLFFEIDYMPPHQLDLTNVITAFAAPTPPGPVRLHVQFDDQIPHNNTTAFVPCTPAAASGVADYDLLKAQFFGTVAERSTVNGRNAKALAFRYGMSVHNLAPAGNTTSGCAEIGGNDFVVSLGSWGVVNNHNVGTRDQQEGTSMHEFGHTLGSRHGGDDNINCKPNYVSVMNYTRQFYSSTNRVLDYSRGTCGVPLAGTVTGLDKATLTESAGIGVCTPSIPNTKVGFGTVPTGGKVNVANAVSVGVSWNKDADLLDTCPNCDINQTTNASGGCPSRQKDPATGLEVQILTGFNDWANMANLQFSFRRSLDFSDGSRDGIEKAPEDATNEITLETALALSGWVIDIKPDDKKNTINRNVTQTIGVSIFSRKDNSVPPQLLIDAPGNGSTTGVNPATLILRCTGVDTCALPVKQNAIGTFQCSTKDEDKDGQNDLDCSFQIPANTMSVGENKLMVLEGSTFDGQPVFGSDIVRVVP